VRGAQTSIRSGRTRDPSSAQSVSISKDVNSHTFVSCLQPVDCGEFRIEVCDHLCVYGLLTVLIKHGAKVLIEELLCISDGTSMHSVLSLAKGEKC
jgi:hypothetical protein